MKRVSIRVRRSPKLAQRLTAGGVLFGLFMACHPGESKPPKPVSRADVLPNPKPNASKDAVVDAAQQGEAEKGEAEPSEAEVNAAEAPKPDPQAPRTVLYTATPDGLKVEISGVSFLVSATSEKLGNGWGVKLELSARVTDSEEHNLLTPEGGPMAFSALVKRGGRSVRTGDKRAGDASVMLATETPFSGSRIFPSEKAQALRAGDELELEIALWGLGADAKSRRPIRDFCLVRMVVGRHTPAPQVLPPKSAASE